MHFFEGFVPIGKAPDAANDGSHVELVTGKEGEDALPDGPVVAEAPLQGDVLLHELIEVESQRLRSPTDFADPAGGADNFEGDF